MVVEIVSNTYGGEADRKLEIYAKLGVPFYAVFDPAGHIMPRPLTFYQLSGGRYIQQPDAALTDRLLTLVLWQGEYEGESTLWLRWADHDGHLIPTGAERAEAEHQRAEAQRQRVEVLAAKLRAAGIDPDA